MRRREFLRDSAVVSVPVLLQGCGLTLPQLSRPTVSGPEDEWLQQFDIDDRSLSQVLDALGARGGDFGEVYFQHRLSSFVRLADGRLLTPAGKTMSGAGLRVVSGTQSGFQHTESLSAENLIALAAAAASGVSAQTPSAMRSASFLPPGDTYSVNDVLPQSDRGELLVSRLDAQVRAADPTISDVDVTLSMTDEWILIATLDGRLVADRRPLLRLSVQAVMTRGTETQSGFAAISARETIDDLDDARLEALAETVVARTRILFDARRPPDERLPVILSAGTAGVLIHEAVGHAFEADFVRERRSPYCSVPGTRVAGEEVTLVDDATLKRQRGALNVDDEGEQGQRTVLVENGRLKSLAYDKRDALAAGVASTGNGRRESFAYEPLPRMTCTSIESGSHEPDALLESMQRGIVAETFTGGTVDLGGGAFRFRVKHGWYVEGGRKTVPVRDFELVGNGPQLLRDISMVANDGRLDEAGWTCVKNGQSVPVSQGMPSVLVAGLGVKPLV